MEKKYYTYIPIRLNSEDYKKGVVNNESGTYFSIFRFVKKEFFIEMEQAINYFCYEENGKYFDLITGYELKLVENEEKINENKIYVKKSNMHLASLDFLFNSLKPLTRKDIKIYKKHINEDVKSKSYLEIILIESNNKDRLEQKEKKEMSVKQKKILRKINKIKRI